MRSVKGSTEVVSKFFVWFRAWIVLDCSSTIASKETAPITMPPILRVVAHMPPIKPSESSAAFFNSPE